FSHANPRALHDHERNITDEQIRACAATGGVVGINGVGILLGDNDASTERLVAAIEYVAELVGLDHVGLGLDYLFDRGEVAEVLANQAFFPAGAGYDDVAELALFEPERLPRLTEALLARGLSDGEAGRVLGGNFERVAEASWTIGKGER